MSSKVNEEYLRSAIFGLEDGLVSTTGAVVGIATGIADKQIVILAAIVVVAVEALSMGAGQYLSQKSSHQLKGSQDYSGLIKGALIMFGAYILGGLVPIIPVLLFPLDSALFTTVVAAFVGLFTVGYVAGKVVKVNPLTNALEMLIVGGLACVLGVVVGYLLKV